MPRVIDESVASSHPDDTPKTAEQLRIAQLEEELRGAQSALEGLSVAKASLELEVVSLKKENASLESLKTEGFKRGEAQQRSKRFAWIMLALILALEVLGFGLYFWFSRQNEAEARNKPDKVTVPLETRVYTIPVSVQNLTRFFPRQNDPECFRGRVAYYGKVDDMNVKLPSLECGGNPIKTYSNGCKDVSNCVIRLSGNYPIHYTHYSPTLDTWSERCPGDAADLYCRVDLLRGE